MGEPTRTSDDGRLLRADEVADLLGVPKSWVYAETRAGRLPHVEVGRYRRYRRAALDAWIAAHENGDDARTGRFSRGRSATPADAPAKA
jgi:excisionase family DNA binding protein